MGNGISKAQTRAARELLNKVKQIKYGKRKKYKLVKVNDHPLTYKEVEVKE